MPTEFTTAGDTAVFLVPEDARGASRAGLFAVVVFAGTTGFEYAIDGCAVRTADAWFPLYAVACADKSQAAGTTSGLPGEYRAYWVPAAALRYVRVRAVTMIPGWANAPSAAAEFMPLDAGGAVLP